MISHPVITDRYQSERTSYSVRWDAQEFSHTILAPIISVGVDFLPQDLDVFPCGSAVQLVDPDLLPAQVVWVPCVVLNVKPEISRTLLGFLHGGVRQEETERQTDRQKMKKHRKKERQTVRDRHSTGVDSNVCCCFYGPCVKKIVLQGLKTEITTWKLRLWHFSVYLLAFNLQILYGPHLQAANYATRRVNEVPVWVKTSVNKCKAYRAALCCFVLRQRYTMCPWRYWETCTPFPQASKPLAIIHLKHPDLLHYHQTNICLQAK